MCVLTHSQITSLYVLYKYVKPISKQQFIIIQSNGSKRQKPKCPTPHEFEMDGRDGWIICMYSTVITP